MLKQFRVIAERIVRTNSLTRRSRGQCLSNSTIVHLFACNAFTNTVTALLWQIIIFSMTFELGYVKQMKVEYGNLTSSRVARFATNIMSITCLFKADRLRG